MLFYVFAFPKDFAMRLLKRKHKRIKRTGLNKKTDCAEAKQVLYQRN
jgi:hypothetical protein